MSKFSHRFTKCGEELAKQMLDITKNLPWLLVQALYLFLELILQLMRLVLIEVTLATAIDRDRDRGGGGLNHE